METRNHCSGAGRHGSGERGRERSPGGRRARLWLRSRLFSFFVHYLFRLRPRPCCRSGRSGPAPLARCLPRAPGTPRLGQPRGATGKGGDPGGAGNRGGWRRARAVQGHFPRPLPGQPKPGSELGGGPLSWPARGQAQPGAPCERAAPRVPRSAAQEAQAARKLLLQCRRSSSACEAPVRPRSRQVSSPVGTPGRDATPGPGAAPRLLLALATAALCAPPTLGLSSAPNSTSCPAEDSWWSGLAIIAAVLCASLVFLTVLVIICYKAIKRKPLRKDENGTSVAEYPMSSAQSNKGVDVSTAVV
ncbi:proline-rich membrane anchor 1 isoform X1 [Meriones unguiculatus]|uniref:proline-rich membrane anchor 1 isoform X1 n=1 Tax=Meriones unguiculatus TaxID=10047 RepID=UPI00293F66A2|nr:proline-rich membrane anchor 1 isoform X1 [Meriones unguiculatus]